MTKNEVFGLIEICQKITDENFTMKSRVLKVWKYYDDDGKFSEYYVDILVIEDKLYASYTIGKEQEIRIMRVEKFKKILNKN